MQIAYNGQVLWSANAFQDGQPHMADFRCAYGWSEARDGGVALDPKCARLLGVEPGQTITHVARW